VNASVKFRLCFAFVLVLTGSIRAQAVSNGMIGLGGRLSWMQSPLEDPRTWIDAQAILRPLPRMFLAGDWGLAKEDRRGAAGDTTLSELRWDLTLGIVVLQGDATGYIPVMWRHTSEKHSWYGDSHWTEIGAGAGALWPLRDWLQLRSEVLWSQPTEAHDELRLGPGQQVDGGHLELSLGFLAFVR
jgi:hypothetical protein